MRSSLATLRLLRWSLDRLEFFDLDEPVVVTLAVDDVCDVWVVNGLDLLILFPLW